MADEGSLEKDMLVPQGQTIDRDGKVHISRAADDPDKVMIGGNTMILIEGTVEI